MTTPTQRLQRMGIVVGALAASLAAAPAHAVLIDQGITYTLTETIDANPLTDRFVLSISGINAATDLEGGRSGVNAIAFTKPANFASAAFIPPPTGFTFVDGGLNSGGCDGSGNFYCFDNTAIPPTPGSPLGVNSTLSFTFDVTLSSGTFAGYVPDFKIDWVGTQNNYDLVSLPLAPTPCIAGGPIPCAGGGNQEIPEPSSLAAVGGALALFGLWWRRRMSV